MLLAACGTTSNWESLSLQGDTKAYLEQQKQLEKPNLDISTVTIVRLNSGGKRIDVSSITPAILKNQAFGWAYAKSLISMDDSRENLRFFTLDIKRNKAYRASFPVSELQPGKSITFPVLGADGLASDVTFVVDRVIVQ